MSSVMETSHGTVMDVSRLWASLWTDQNVLEVEIRRKDGEVITLDLVYQIAEVLERHV